MAERGRPLPLAVRLRLREYLFERRLSERRTALLLAISRNTVKKYRTSLSHPGTKSA